MVKNFTILERIYCNCVQPARPYNRQDALSLGPAKKGYIVNFSKVKFGFIYLHVDRLLDARCLPT